jgi:hypothetical protein
MRIFILTLASLFALFAQQNTVVKHRAAAGVPLTGTFHSGSHCITGQASCEMASPLAVTVGDLILCYVSTTTVPNGAPASCSDSDGDVFSPLAGPTATTDGVSSIGELLAATASVTNASEAVTATVSSSSNYMSGAAIALTLSHSPTLDQHPAAGQYATTAMTTGTTGATAQASEIAVAGYSVKNGAGGGVTPIPSTVAENCQWSSSGQGNQSDTFLCWQQLSAAGTYQGTATASVSETGVGHIVTFK